MTVSHELRTPLTAIRGHVSALREGSSRIPTARTRRSRSSQVETERLERLVHDVLDLAKLDAHRFTVHRDEVDMERLVEHAYTAFAEEARRRAIDYQRRRCATRPTITTDGDRVLQIITNLLANAFRWTPDGGRVGSSSRQSHGAVRSRSRTRGRGSRSEEQERIFRPFWSRDGARHRARPCDRARAVGRARRADRAASEVGFGSRFELVLPADGAVPGRLPRVGAPAAVAPRSGRRPRRLPVCSRSSIRASRSSTPFQPETTRSTSTARSSTRALPLGEQRRPRAARAGGSPGSSGRAPRRAGARPAAPRADAFADRVADALRQRACSSSAAAASASIWSAPARARPRPRRSAPPVGASRSLPRALDRVVVHRRRG